MKSSSNLSLSLLLRHFTFFRNVTGNNRDLTTCGVVFDTLGREDDKRSSSRSIMNPGLIQNTLA